MEEVSEWKGGGVRKKNGGSQPASLPQDKKQLAG